MLGMLRAIISERCAPSSRYGAHHHLGIGTLEPFGNRMTSNSATNKPFSIDKRRVYEAYKAVKSNRGAAGVDGRTLEMFETDLAGDLY